MNKLIYSSNKVLRLTNVLKYKMLFEEEDIDLKVVAEQRQSYMKTKGYTGSDSPL